MADRDSPIKVGLIGCGHVTENLHLPALRLLADTEVIAVADIDPEPLKRVAGRFHIRECYQDYRALLDNPAIEVVGVCVPARFHVEVALAALDAGKHMLIEKPLALGLDECDLLMERAAQCPSKVMVGFNLRRHRLVRQAREIIQRGALGPIQLIRTVFTSGGRYRWNTPQEKGRRALGQGVLFELAVHHFDLWRFLLDSEVEEIFATSQSGQWEDEVATVTARLDKGVLAASAFSESTSDDHQVQIYGAAGGLNVACHRFDGLQFRSALSDSNGIRTRLQRLAQVLAELPQAVLMARQGGIFFDSYRAEWRHLIDCIRQDTPPECTLEDGRRAVQVVLAAMMSASLGEPVRVAQGPRTVTPGAFDIRAAAREQARRGSP